MATSFNPKRLLLEVLLLVGLAEVCVMLILPVVAPGLDGLREGLLDVALLLLLSGPAVYWRFMGALKTDGHSAAQIGPGDSSSRFALVLTAITQALGLLLTAGGIWWQSSNLDGLSQSRFDQGAERTQAEVVRRLNQPLFGLKGARGAMAANSQFKRQAFRSYVEARDLPNEFPGIRGFGFVRRVLRADLDAFVARERADGAPDFAVRTSGPADDLYVVSYLEPLAPNRAAWGVDIGQEARRRAAAEYAVATGEATLSDRIQLVQDEAHRPGFLYFLPVYKPGANPQTPAERQRDLQGLLYVPMVASELLASVASANDNLLDFELFDGPNADPGKLMFDADGVLSIGKVARHGVNLAERKFVTEKVIFVGGHVLTLRASSTARFEAAQDRSSLIIIGLGGTLVSFLMAIAVWLLAVGRQRAQVLADTMTSELSRMALVVQHTDNAVTIADSAMRIQWVNQGFVRITGYSVEEALGRTPGELLSSGNSAPEAIQALADGVRLGRACRVELVNRTKDGREYWADTEVQPTFDKQGVLVGFVEIGTDISERKQYEGSLREAREKAELATQTKGQFLANMSHEIRTPMNAILGMLKLLRNTELNSHQRDYADKTEGAAKSLLALVNDILDFSKVEAGKMTLDPQPFRLDHLMRDLAVILSSTVGSKGIEVLFDIDPDLPDVLLGDSMRLQQVLINLGGNAVKFTAQGQVVIAVRLLHNAGGTATVEFAVQDSGIGIAAENQAHIFTGFSQAEASTTRKFGGTGLGLSISQRLVALMGGELRLTSALGEGSTFAFSLQMQAVLPVPAALESVRATPVGVHRVLVVDNNPVARELLARTTRNWGWPTEVAASGEAALQVVQAGLAPGGAPFDLIYMDWQMPDMDGWATTRQLRQRYAAHAVAQPVVVMVSANSRASLEQRTVEEQALLNAFLMKPVTASMLLDAVQDASACGAGVRRSRRTGAGKRRLSGMHILVVEDNLINQQVAEELLMSEGALVSMAANGQLGVDAIAAAAASKQFDAVLMDMQMPVLDGFGATRVVRQQLQLARLPIIAMTANAMASDRVECLAAGMNEHVGKPFDLDHLVHTLLRVTGFKAPQWMDAPDAVVTTAPLAAPAPSAPAALDMAVVDATVVDMAGAQARMGGSSALYLRLAQQFVESLAAELAQLQAALAGPPAQATLLAHSLKGTAAILGALQLSQRAADLEKLCKAQAGGGELNSAWLRVESAAQETAASLQAALQAKEAEEAEEAGETGPPAAGYALPQPAQREAVSLAMAELMPLLQAEDFAALEIFAGMRAVLAEVPEALLSPLEEALQDLDMERALQACGVIDDWSSACQTQASRRSPSSLKKR